MTNIIKIILLPLSLFFIEQYKAIQAVRPDDSPWQTLVLYNVLICGELAVMWMLIECELFKWLLDIAP